MYEKVVSSPYKYLNSVNSNSFDESLLIEMTVKDLEGKDGEISSNDLKTLWHKIKANIKKSIGKGNHKNNLIQNSFLWNSNNKYFADLVMEEFGLFNKLIESYVERYNKLPLDETMEELEKRFVLLKFQEI